VIAYIGGCKLRPPFLHTFPKRLFQGLTPEPPQIGLPPSHKSYGGHAGGQEDRKRVASAFRGTA
jgi:hypothetical protein